MTEKTTITCKVCGKTFNSQMHADNHSFWEHRERWKEADTAENGPQLTPNVKPSAGKRQDDDDDETPWWVR